jgi:hypothetical protein
MPALTRSLISAMMALSPGWRIRTVEQNIQPSDGPSRRREWVPAVIVVGVSLGLMLLAICLIGVCAVVAYAFFAQPIAQ